MVYSVYQIKTCLEKLEMIILEKYTEKDFELYSELVFNEQVMNMNMGRVFTKEEAVFFYKAILDLNANSSCLGYIRFSMIRKGLMSILAWAE